jgi:hypothetical protein
MVSDDMLWVVVAGSFYSRLTLSCVRCHYPSCRRVVVVVVDLFIVFQNIGR